MSTSASFLTPAQLEAIEHALAKPDTTILPPAPQPGDGSDEIEDWAELRIERKKGNLWRVRFLEAGASGEVASEWRPRERYYSQLSLFLGKLRNFALKGLGKIPLSINPPRPKDES